MSRRDAHLGAMFRNLGATYCQTTQGRARAADVSKALRSVAGEDRRLNVLATLAPPTPRRTRSAAITTTAGGYTTS